MEDEWVDNDSSRLVRKRCENIDFGWTFIGIGQYCNFIKSGLVVKLHSNVEFLIWVKTLEGKWDSNFSGQRLWSNFFFEVFDNLTLPV